jgi:hemoglobin-like flavoprotein
MATIRQWLGMEPKNEEQPMEQPRSPWTPTEPDQETRTDSPWGSRSAEEAPMKDDRTTAERAIVEARVTRDNEDMNIPMAHDPDQTTFQEAEQRLADRDPLTDSGVHYMGLPGLDATAPTSGAGQAQDDAAGDRCPHCGARIPSDHELLTEVLGWLAPAGDDFVHEFYIELFEARPDLRPLFPDDIQLQEEKLLTAIVSLLRMFKAGEQEMEQLNSALAKFGRSHTRFDPAATIEEYAAVWTVLAGVAVRMLGDKLTDRHVAALRRAYEYGAGMMLAAQATAKLAGVGRRRRTV